MTQGKPTRKSNIPKVKHVRVDRYAKLAAETWEERKRTIDALPSNASLQAGIEPDIQNKKKVRKQSSAEELTQ